MSGTFNYAKLIRRITILLVLFSIMTTYYVMIVQKDYVIFTNPGGPDTEDYFDELFAA